MDRHIRWYGKNSRISTITAMTVTIISEIANQSLHMAIQLMMMHYHTKFQNILSAQSLNQLHYGVGV